MWKYPNKALVFRNWKYSKWFIPIVILELFFLYIPNLVSSNEFIGPMLNHAIRKNSNPINYLLIAVTLALMSALLYSYDKKSSNYTLAASLPFKKSEIIRANWFVGVYNILIPYFFIYVIMNSILICNFCWGRFFIDVTKWVIINVLISICIFSFITMAQTLNGSAIFGSFLAALWSAFPFTLLYLLYGMVYLRYSYSSFYGIKPIMPQFIENMLKSGIVEKVFALPSFLFNMDNPFFNVNYNTVDTEQPQSGLQFLQGNLGFFIRIAVFLAVIIIFYKLALKYYNRFKNERIGNLSTEGVLNKINCVLISYYIGFLVIIFTSVLSSPQKAFRSDLVIIFCVVLPVILNFALGKMIKLHRKFVE